MFATIVIDNREQVGGQEVLSTLPRLQYLYIYSTNSIYIILRYYMEYPDHRTPLASKYQGGGPILSMIYIWLNGSWFVYVADLYTQYM